MKTILLIIALVIAYVILKLVVSFVFGTVRVTLKRRKIAKLDRLDRMDNGNRLRTYFLEIQEIKQGILDKWPGQFPPGDEGKLVKELAWDSLMCIQQNPRVCLKAGERDSNETR
ncbi:MAG: hypothetical protein DME54_14035 [Verrucomicrobia bacterium]|nr:MAG: hypothetical protein DME54_14035 [Verrucomicrobiota bacterium]